MSTSFNPLQLLREQQQCPPTLRVKAATEGRPTVATRGWHVKLLRRCLAASGLYSGEKREELLNPNTAVSDLYDAPLAALVRKYQERHGLDVDGICGPQTWRHLAGWICGTAGGDDWPEPKHWSHGRSGLPEIVQPAALRQEMVRLARQELHVREQGHNRGAEVERILRQAEGSPGDAWCAAFCEALLEWACQNLGLPVPFEIGLSCSALVHRAEAAGRIVPPGQEQPGDLWVLKGGPTGWKHVGLIVELFPASTQHTRLEGINEPRAATIEGNTNAAGSSEGDGVYAKTRSLDRAKCCVVRCV